MLLEVEQALVLMFLSVFFLKKEKFISLFSHAFTVMGSYAFFRDFLFQLSFGNHFTCMQGQYSRP